MNKSEIAEKAAREIVCEEFGQSPDDEGAVAELRTKINRAKIRVERAIAESQAPQPTVSYGPPHNRDGEAGSCTRCGSIHRGIVKNRTTPEGREFWDHVDKVAADCCLRCGRSRPEHDFNSPTACGLFEEPHPTQQPVKKFEERSRDLGNSESAESGAKIVTQENPPFVLSHDCESNSITTPPSGYNRDEVRRLEREIEESGTNRFVGRKESEPRGTCSKHVGLHVNIEELCEEWHEEREFAAYCKALGFWPTDENFKIWKESPLRGFATSGPLCDNCSKTSREHYCYFGSSYDEKFSPSERRSDAANEEARRLRIVIDTETKPLHAQIEKLKKDLADTEATCEAWMEEAEQLKTSAELGDGEPSPCKHERLDSDGTCKCGWSVVTRESGAAQEVSPEHILRNLLAVIHRDGGHYATEHGLEKAGEDAQALVLKERAQEVSPPSPDAFEKWWIRKGWDMTGRPGKDSVIYKASKMTFESVSGDTRELKAALKLVTEKFRQHFREGDHALHWRDALDALAAAEKLLGDEGL